MSLGEEKRFAITLEFKEYIIDLPADCSIDFSQQSLSLQCFLWFDFVSWHLQEPSKSVSILYSYIIVLQPVFSTHFILKNEIF